MTEHPGPSRAQRLAADAADAAAVREALSHPDVAALRIERTRTRVDAAIWTGLILGLLFTLTNVQAFAANTIGAVPYSATWWATWLLDPVVSVTLLGVLMAERVTARWQIPVGRWARLAKWSLLASTYGMNTWASWADGHAAGIVLHSIPPLVVFVGAEALTDCHSQLTEAIYRSHADAVDRARERASHDPGGESAAPAPTSAADEPPAPSAPATSPPEPEPVAGFARNGRLAESCETRPPQQPRRRAVTDTRDRPRAPVPGDDERPPTELLAERTRELIVAKGGDRPSQRELAAHLGVTKYKAGVVMHSLNGHGSPTGGGSR